MGRMRGWGGRWRRGVIGVGLLMEVMGEGVGSRWRLG